MVSSSILAGLLGVGLFAGIRFTPETYWKLKSKVRRLYTLGLMSLIFPFAIVMVVAAGLYHTYLYFALLSGMLVCVGLYLYYLYKIRDHEHSYGRWNKKLHTGDGTKSYILEMEQKARYMSVRLCPCALLSCPACF